MSDKKYIINPIEVEWHQLDLRYATLRTHTHADVNRFMLSVKEHGLLMPITIVASGLHNKPWIVIDGYLRIAAYRALRLDTILATPWNISLTDALCCMYQQDTSRAWNKLEEARLLQELITLHKISQATVAKRLGKSQSWVTYRLQLLLDLPNFLQEAIDNGTISTWAASRILVPFARANTEHAKLLIKYLTIHKQSCRDIQEFFYQYLHINRHKRQQIAVNPDIFFKAHAFKKSNNVDSDKLAPEFIWVNKITQILNDVQILQSVLPAVFYREQDKASKDSVFNPFQELVIAINALDATVRSKLHA